ncbi:MAG: S8 family serine peptidase, partial [Bacteroidota bacterium]
MQGALRLFLGLLCWGLFAPVEAQRLDHVLGEVLIKTYPGTNHLQNLERKAQYRSSGFRALFQHLRPQAGVLGWHQLRFDHNDIHEGELLQWLREQEEVEYAQFNHFLEWRQTTPNDPLFSRQWQYINEDLNGTLSGIDLDAELAWDITTGGLTPRGDTIVVAVIDNGFYLNHPDFEDNIWINHADFPNNRRDEDENGYLDDYLGWNILTQNDDIQPPGLSEHGTAVAGIIGARGDNGIGVTGVNWQVKLMIISNDELFTEARVLQAYDYVLTQRQLYNDTQGEEGAFVVATNASWGRSNAFPEDAPIWCAMYDTLGSAGILNCGATANSNVDV